MGDVSVERIKKIVSRIPKEGQILLKSIIVESNNGLVFIRCQNSKLKRVLHLLQVCKIFYYMVFLIFHFGRRFCRSQATEGFYVQMVQICNETNFDERKN